MLTELYSEASKIQKKLNHIIEILQREENADMRRYEQLDEVIAKSVLLPLPSPRLSHDLTKPQTPPRLHSGSRS